MTLFFARRFRGFIVSFSAVGAVACSSGSGSLGLYGDGGTSEGRRATDTTEGTGTGGSTSTGTSCASKYPASQSLSQPCCTERGADACGAGLFCAAFDGRTQSTCYAERSRAEGQTCTADIQCVRDTCTTSGICKYTPPPPPPTAKCPATCKLDSDCQATCPVSGSSIACCDTGTGVCYQSGSGMCPTP